MDYTTLKITVALAFLGRSYTQTEGAGFNIAHIASFACTTISLWNK